MTSTDVTPDLSLLWLPDHETRAQPRLTDAAVNDLDLARTMTALDSWGYSIRPGQSPLYEVVWRVGQLETYVEVIQGLQAAFEGLERPLRAVDRSAARAGAGVE